MNKKSKPVLVLMQREVVEVMDSCVQRLDLDRSKFIRAAVREKIQRETAELTKSIEVK